VAEVREDATAVADELAPMGSQGEPVGTLRRECSITF
jgi:hypothetical protein